MALVAEDSVEVKAVSARVWLSQNSASQQQQQLPLSSTRKPASKSKERVVSQEMADENFLFSGMNFAHVGSVEVVLQTLDMLMSSDNETREDGIPLLASTRSPLVKLNTSKSSSNQATHDDGVPPLTSTCSPLIKSKSSRSSSNQGSLPGLVVAPDGVSLVKDRRKCKPRGVLTVGVETSSFSSEGEVALPIASPSVATVEWVDESWNDTVSPHKAHVDELYSTVTSKSLRSHRTALNFNCHEDSTKELSVKDPSSTIREVVELLPETVPSVQESYDVRESLEGFPTYLILADSDVSFRPEPVPELLPSAKDRSVSTFSSKQQHMVGSIQGISPPKQMSVPDLDRYDSFGICQNWQLDLQDDVNGSPGTEINEEPYDYSSDIIPYDHSETKCLAIGKGGTHLEISGNRSSEIDFIFPLSVSPTLLEHPENEGASNVDVLLGSCADLAYAQGLHIVRHKHGEGSEMCGSELSQRPHHAGNQLSPEEVVAETLYQLAAENLRKARTGARRFNSLEEKTSLTEAASLLSIVNQSASSVDTSTSGDHATHPEEVPYVLNSRTSRKVRSKPELAKVDLAQPLRTIVLSRESDFSQNLTTLKALIGNVHVEAHHGEVQGLPATFEGVQKDAGGMHQSSLALSRKTQRQCRQLSSGYYTNSMSAFRKAHKHRRLSSCGKHVGFGSILAATATFGFVVVSLVIGSCHQCYKSNQYHYYIQPT